MSVIAFIEHNDDGRTWVRGYHLNKESIENLGDYDYVDVTEIKDVIPIKGKEAVIFIDLDTKEQTVEYFDIPTSSKFTEIQELWQIITDLQIELALLKGGIN